MVDSSPNNDAKHQRTRERMELCLFLIGQGLSVYEALADPRIAVSYSAYRQWRMRYPRWAAAVDTGRATAEQTKGPPADLSSAQFALKYFGRVRAPFQQQWVNEVESMRKGNILLALWPPEFGKLLRPSEPVPTPTGWTTMGELAVGDEVFAVDGTPTKVTYVSPRQMTDGYRITFTDHTSIDCGGEHLWEVVSRNHRTPTGRYATIVVDTRQVHYTTNANNRPIFSIPMMEAMDLPDTEYTIPPYVLGAWLGDGSTGAANITSGDQDRARMVALLEANGIKVGHQRQDPRTGAWTLRINIDGARWHDGFQPRSMRLGTWVDKHIPMAYLRGSRAQRLELLRGLMDTDGSCSKVGMCEFGNSNERLIDQVGELLLSLGHRFHKYKTRAMLNGIDYGPTYRLSFLPDELVFHLERKAERQAPTRGTGGRMKKRAIMSVEEIGLIEGVCITVDHPRHLYVAGTAMIVTHNTTTFEDFATEKICRDATWRNTVVSENDRIAKAIVGRVRNRLEPDGPFPGLIKDWGPFRPDAGRSYATSAFRQPWNNTTFAVAKNRVTDERDHNMLAISWKSSTVSIRTDHLHIDDIQSTKTLDQTEKQIGWFRQDGLSRPGETGITTINMTRVGDGDFPSVLEDDNDLGGILKVIKLRAIVRNQLTGELESAWPQKFTLEGLDRIRRKVKDEAFDRNYMMDPGASQKERTFTDQGKARALNPLRRLNSFEGFEKNAVVVLALDPGLKPGKCTLMGWVLGAEMMQLVYLKEDDTFMRNEQIIEMIDTAANQLSKHFRVAHLVVEAMNFQRGLARDERLADVKNKHGFTMGEHMTNVNKYDDNIGLASMAGDWEAGKIELPYGPDELTRLEIDETCKQFKAWKPLKRGSKLRQDRVMTTWFAWIYWCAKRGTLTPKPQNWHRQGVSSVAGKPQLIIPIGVRL